MIHFIAFILWVLMWAGVVAPLWLMLLGYRWPKVGWLGFLLGFLWLAAPLTWMKGKIFVEDPQDPGSVTKFVFLVAVVWSAWGFWEMRRGTFVIYGWEASPLRVKYGMKGPPNEPGIQAKEYTGDVLGVFFEQNGAHVKITW